MKTYIWIMTDRVYLSAEIHIHVYKHKHYTNESSSNMYIQQYILI